MNKKDYRIDTLGRADGGMKVTCPANMFVKITHIKSNISVTGYGKSQIKARDMALIELERLVEKWQHS